MKKDGTKIRTMFRIEKPHLDRVDQLAKKLKLNRSQAIRLCLDEGIEKYVEPGYKGEWQIINTAFLNTILTNLGNRIFELENPRGRVGARVREATEAARKVSELREQGKGKEADKIVNERAAQGLSTVSFSWVDDEK